MRRQFSDHQHDAYVGHLVRDLLSGRPADPLLAELGWDHDGFCLVLVAALDSPGEDRRTEQAHFATTWRSAVQHLGSALPCVDLASEVVAVLPLTGEVEERRAGADLVHRAVAAVAGEGAGFTCGVSRPARATGLAAAYDQASRAVEVGRRVHGGGVTAFFDDLGLDRLLASIGDRAELRRFAHDVLGPLAGDDPEAEALRVTLQALLDTNFNVAEAARAQFFHYNTMRYRLATGSTPAPTGPRRRSGCRRAGARRCGPRSAWSGAPGSRPRCCGAPSSCCSTTRPTPG